MVLMLQREVVERLLAPAGTTDRGFISVLVEAYCEAEKLFDVAPGAFRPPPKVWSSVMRLKFRPRINADVADQNLLWETVSAGFAQKRRRFSITCAMRLGSFAGDAQAQRRREHRPCAKLSRTSTPSRNTNSRRMGRIVQAME
jgi:16S rRNA A1518/A1519 N6-dimethyltransferase RsmA/KsgA/DIM1 with predicted DNA glycosylase/AP lyase activity